jgi:hypothetical protein
MTNAYVSSVAYTAVAQWAATTAYTLGQYRRQLAAPAVGSERVFKCTTAGTSGGTEPAWNLNNNATTTDGTVTWTQVAGQEANQSAGNWTAPHARIDNARSVMSLAAGDTVFVSSDHAETKAAASSIAASSQFILSVSRAGATLPPTSADLLAGASVAATGASDITLAGYFWGFTFSAGSGSSTANIIFTTINSLTTLENCALILNNTSASSTITTSSTFKGDVILNNTTMTFGSTSQKIVLVATDFRWIGTANAILGSAPATLFNGGGGNALRQSLQVRGVDLSAITGTILGATSMVGSCSFVDCKLNSAVTPTSATAGGPLSWVRFHNCDDSTNGRNYRFFELYQVGSVQSESAVYLDAGASDGVTRYSHKFTNASGTSGTLAIPLTGNWISKRVNTTGSGVTLSIEIISPLATAPTNAQIWIEAEALATAGVPLATYYTTRAQPAAAGTTLTASSRAWGAGVTARANSTAYVVGDIRKVASNPGRLFFCSTAGTSAGSEPAGYATAIDGGSVTDGTAVFRAMWRQTASVGFTPAVKGVVRARVNTAFVAASPNQTVYVDPKLWIV